MIDSHALVLVRLRLVAAVDDADSRARRFLPVYFPKGMLHMSLALVRHRVDGCLEG